MSKLYHFDVSIVCAFVDISFFVKIMALMTSYPKVYYLEVSSRGVDYLPFFWLIFFQEVICGKCTILCTSEDVRNKQPSPEDLKNADYFFSQIYNVDLQHFTPIHKVVNKLGCHGEA